MFFFEIEHVAEANVQVHHRRKEMSEDLRKQVYQALLARSNNGILHKKDTQIIADRFDLHLRSVQQGGVVLGRHLRLRRDGVL